MEHNLQPLRAQLTKIDAKLDRIRIQLGQAVEGLRMLEQDLERLRRLTSAAELSVMEQP